MVTAIISPTNTRRDGLLAKSSSYNFLYRKEDGIWNLKNKLTEAPSK
jgi:hypothetical protein